MINNDKFSYKGLVDIKLKLKDKIINCNTHNVGFDLLFYFIASAISGELQNRYIPRKVQIYYTDISSLFEGQTPTAEQRKTISTTCEYIGNSFTISEYLIENGPQENNPKYSVLTANKYMITGNHAVNSYPEIDEYTQYQGKYSTSITASIPFSSQLYNALNSSTIDIENIEKYKFIVVLFGTTDNSPLACFEISYDILAQLVAGAQLLITWYLMTGN